VISEYLLDNVLFLTHKYGLIDMMQADNSTSLSVIMLKTAFGGNFTGYDSTAPCKFGIKSLDPFPDIIMLKNNS
jgi:hypothetical protein